METHAGTKRIKEEGTMPDYRMVYYGPESMTNLFSISEIVKKGNHVYINTREDNFLLSWAETEKIQNFHAISGGSMSESMRSQSKEGSYPIFRIMKIVMTKIKIIRFMHSQTSMSKALLLIK